MFEVAKDANKIDVKRAVEKLLGPKVASVRTSITRGKLKRQGRFVGRRSDWKKAYVTLREGEKLPDFPKAHGIERRHADPQIQADYAGPPPDDLVTFDEITTDKPHAPLTENAAAARVAATAPVSRPFGGAAAVTSACIASSTSSATRPASPARSRRSSTTRTGRPASR